MEKNHYKGRSLKDNIPTKRLIPKKQDQENKSQGWISKESERRKEECIEEMASM
jgi:hypothetical protein